MRESAEQLLFHALHAVVEVEAVGLVRAHLCFYFGGLGGGRVGGVIPSGSGFGIDGLGLGLFDMPSSRSDVASVNLGFDVAAGLGGRGGGRVNGGRPRTVSVPLVWIGAGRRFECVFKCVPSSNAM